MTDCGAEHPESGTHQHQHEHHGADGGHSHGVTASSDSRFIAAALGLIAGFLVFEVVMAFVGHSLALLADAGHMLTDAGALGASLLAIRLSRRPASGVWTFGFKRVEVLSAQANGITLLVISALVASGAVSRLIHPQPVTGPIVVAVAAVGVAVNVAATWVMAKANRDSVNVKGAFAHVVTDLYGFIGTLAAGIVIIVTGYERADSIASLIVVGLMLHAAWGLLSETGRILLEAAPEGYAPGEIITAISRQPGVASVHDVHVWLITSGFPALSAHVLVQPPADCHRVRRELEQLLCAQFALDHTTLQVDHAPDDLLTLGRETP
jgi:cobalt-zinc-cadmium efflux system protein